MRYETKPSGLGHILKALLAVSAIVLFAGTALASSAGDQGSHGWMSTDTYRILCFIVLVGALVFILRKPVPSGLNARIKGIKDELQQLDLKKREADELLSQYNEKLSQLNEESEKIISQYVDQGEESKEKIIKAAEAAAKKLEEQAQNNIKNEFEKARVSIKKDIIDKALSKAEKIIKEKISSVDHSRLIDDYLKKVVA
jgi:F-type H+-transporting ATPase subunit b